MSPPQIVSSTGFGAALGVGFGAGAVPPGVALLVGRACIKTARSAEPKPGSYSRKKIMSRDLSMNFDILDG